MQSNTKTAIARATGRPRRCRDAHSIANCAALRLKASACDSMRFYTKIHRRIIFMTKIMKMDDFAHESNEN